MVTDDSAIPDVLPGLRTALDRTRAVGMQLVGLSVHDANELAARSRCELREVRRDGKWFAITADLRTNRINIETEGGVVISASVG